MCKISSANVTFVVLEESVYSGKFLHGANLAILIGWHRSKSYKNFDVHVVPCALAI